MQIVLIVNYYNDIKYKNISPILIIKKHRRKGKMNKRKLFQSKNYNAKNETKSSKFNLNNFGNKNYSKSKKQAGITLIALVI